MKTTFATIVSLINLTNAQIDLESYNNTPSGNRNIAGQSPFDSRSSRRGQTGLISNSKKSETVIKETDTMLANMNVAVAVDTQTKKEDLQVTSMVQIIQQKLEKKMVTYEERKEGSETKGCATIYFDSKAELDAIYTTEELRQVRVEEKESIKEAAFVSCVGKVLLESKKFDFKNHENIYIQLEVRNQVSSQSKQQIISQQEIHAETKQTNVNFSQNRPGSSINASGSSYISRVHKVTVASSKKEAIQLDNQFNHIDISNSQEQVAVNYLFQQVGQTQQQFYQSIETFIRKYESVKIDETAIRNSRQQLTSTRTQQTTQSKTTQIALLARNMKQTCGYQKRDQRQVQGCLFNYVEKNLVIYDSSLVTTQIKSKEQAVKQGDRLNSITKDCSGCSNIALTFPKFQEFGFGNSIFGASGNRNSQGDNFMTKMFNKFKGSEFKMPNFNMPSFESFKKSFGHQ